MKADLKYKFGTITKMLFELGYTRFEFLVNGNMSIDGVELSMEEAIERLDTEMNEHLNN